VDFRGPARSVNRRRQPGRYLDGVGCSAPRCRRVRLRDQGEMRSVPLERNADEPHRLTLRLARHRAAARGDACAGMRRATRGSSLAFFPEGPSARSTAAVRLHTGHAVCRAQADGCRSFRSHRGTRYACRTVTFMGGATGRSRGPDARAAAAAAAAGSPDGAAACARRHARAIRCTGRWKS